MTSLMMNTVTFLSAILLAGFCTLAPRLAQASAGPTAVQPPASRPAAQDRPFPGVVTLYVDATDTAHKVMRVHETVPVLPGDGSLVLLYPQWETASHGPTAEANALAGLQVFAGGQPLTWRRDPYDVFAFRIAPPQGVQTVDVQFQYVSPTSPGRMEMEPDAVTVQWQHVLVYPAGWYARDIPVRASLRLPEGFTPATSLAAISKAGEAISFERVSLETLVDSPVLAGRSTRRFDLGRLDGAPVRLDLQADAPADLAIPDAYLQKLRAMVGETGRVFGPPHFGRYDILVSESDLLPADGGTEHLRSSENGFAPGFFIHPQQNLIYQDLLAHEFVHSWNGKAVTPQALWTPDFNTPSDDAMLWVYEGQTEYWGIVLAARAGLRTRQQTLDLFAVKAAEAKARIGRAWKSMADSSLDPVYDAGHGVTWPDWQGREAYYVEGPLLWLDVDTLIRERTGGRRSLDDFARAFFGGTAGDATPRTYTFDDLCAGLNRIAPMDWAAFIRARLDVHDDAHLFDGLRRGGYELTYAATATETARQAGVDAGGLDLRSSLGVLVGDGGRLRRVAWDSPAFRAGLSVGAKLTKVADAPYSDAALLASLSSDKSTIELGFVQDGVARTVALPRTPATYPTLTPTAGRRWLDEIVSARAPATAIVDGPGT